AHAQEGIHRSPDAPRRSPLGGRTSAARGPSSHPSWPSAQIEHANLLGGPHADLPAGLDRFLAEELVEEADAFGELAVVFRERRDLGIEEPRDVFGAGRFVRPRKPDVVDVLCLQTLAEVFAEEVRVAAPG